MDSGEFRVIITEPIHPIGVERLRGAGIMVEQLPPGSNEDALMDVAPRADALITRGGIKVTRAIMASSPRLRVIGVHGVGCDHVDLKAAEEFEKIVFNTPSALTETVAEMTLALMLALARRVVSADKAVRSGQWNRKYGDLIGSELMGKTIGIVGLGRIGESVARRLKPFGADLIYFDIADRAHLEAELGLRRVDLDTLLRMSDIITLHVPLTSQTKRLVSRREFDLVKDGAYIVNTSRGMVIDQQALIETLKSGKIAGAALDVFEKEPLNPADPLNSLDNVILTPHLGASSREAMQRMSLQLAKGILKVSKGGIPEGIVVPKTKG